MVQVSWGSEPFLRRPLAVLGQTSDEVELLYRVKGTGTELLAAKRAGERVKVIGPLGKGFTRRTGDHVIYMAGGTDFRRYLPLQREWETARSSSGRGRSVNCPSWRE